MMPCAGPLLALALAVSTNKRADGPAWKQTGDGLSRVGGHDAAFTASLGESAGAVGTPRGGWLEEKGGMSVRDDDSSSAVASVRSSGMEEQADDSSLLGCVYISTSRIHRTSHIRREFTQLNSTAAPKPTPLNASSSCLWKRV